MLEASSSHTPSHAPSNGREALELLWSEYVEYLLYHILSEGRKFLPEGKDFSDFCPDALGVLFCGFLELELPEFEHLCLELRPEICSLGGKVLFDFKDFRSLLFGEIHTPESRGGRASEASEKPRFTP